MTEPGEAGRELRRMLSGGQVAQVICVAARLGLSDLLAERSRTVGELAEATSTHEPSLRRLMRALEALGLYERDADERFLNTALGSALRTGALGGAAEWARQAGRPYVWNTWSRLFESIHTGQNTFTAVHGMSIWQWREEHAEDRQAFDAAMVGITRAVIDSVVAAYDFSRFGTVVDIGGGHGALLGAVLATYPSVRGVLFDQPTALRGAQELMAEVGVAERCELVGGDFFESVPSGVDAYVLKSVIHDWEDEESIAILRTCRQAAAPGASLLLVEQLLDRATNPLGVALADINMFVLPGGRERTSDEYGALLAAAGWSLTRIVPTTTDFSVVEAAAA